jgi:pimeloyl-ACP methyl ester carboxylesterase
MSRLLSFDEKEPAQYLTYPSAPGVHEGRVRFRQIVCTLAQERATGRPSDVDCENLLWRLNDEPLSPPAWPALPPHDPRLRILIVPGAFAECFLEFGMPFEDAGAALKQRGYRIDFIPVGGRSGADHNAGQIAAAVEQLPSESGERVLLIGHSKGAVDILHFLVNHPQPARRISAVVSVSGPIMGSPLADALSGIYARFFSRMPFTTCTPGDRAVVESLKRSYQTTWLASHRLPDHIRYFSLATFARREDIHPLMLFTYDLLAGYDPRNDGYVAFSDQVIPGATLLGYANLDHWDIALPVRERLNFGGINSRSQAREILFQAMVLTAAESLEGSR